MKQKELWQIELAQRITSPDMLPAGVTLTAEERDFCNELSQNGSLPFCITPSFLRAVEHESKKLRGPAEDNGNCTACAPLRKQVIPSPQERHVLDYELADPLGEYRFQKTERLVHQYYNRALLLTTGICFSYCRHCFRRVYAGKQHGFITPEQQADVCAYLHNHKEISEILISGGDPLTADNASLRTLFTAIRRARPEILFRICTRAPVFIPSRFTPDFIDLLRSFRPLWVIPHINHPSELTEQTVTALSLCIDNGIPVQSQTVLLNGVNNNADILTELFTRLVKFGIKPGYLFQGDLAPGTSHLRVPVTSGIELYRKLEYRLSGLSLPVYAVDLPGGGGKMPLGGRCPDKVSSTYLEYTSKAGGTYRYPCE